MKSSAGELLATMLLSCLGQSNSLVVQRPLLKMLGGDFAAACLLSQVVYWTDRTTDDDGWFWKTYEQWDEEICLSRCQVDRAIKVLKEFGLERETRRHNNSPTAFYRVNRAVLLARIEQYARSMQQASNSESTCRKPAGAKGKSTCRKTTVAPVENPQVPPVENLQVSITKPTEAKTTAAAAKHEPGPEGKHEVKSTPPATEKNLLDFTDAEAEALPVRDLLRLYYALPIARSYFDKLDEIQNRADVHSPGKVKRIEILESLPGLRAKRDKAASRAARPSAPFVTTGEAEAARAIFQRSSQTRDQRTKEALSHL